MSEQTVVINDGDPGAKGPSIEESYKSLVAEGVIPDEDGNMASNDEAANEGSNDDRPEWLPEKFKSPEDMAKAYAELERKMAGGQKSGAEEATANQPGSVSAEEQAAAEEAATRAGLDLSKVSEEWYANDGLTAETYDKLAKAGYPREMVDIYIEGLTNRAQATTAEAYSVTGGQEGYAAMIDWAIDNLDAAEQKAFDAAVNSNSRAAAMMAIRGLKARMDTALAANASQEPAEQISKGRGGAGNSYESIDDYLEDLNDPRYDTNETFRNRVAAKLSRSKIM